MMKFLKKHSYEIIRLFVIQIGMTIFSLIVTTTASMAFEDKGGADVAKLAVSIFAIGFHMFVVYTTMWEVGFKRQEKLELGREPQDALFGGKIAFVANIPNLILSLLMVIGLLRLVSQSNFFIGLFGIARLIDGFLNATYLGLIGYLLPSSTNALYYILTAVLCLASVLPAIIVSQIACRLGEKNIRLTKGKAPSLE